MGLSPHTKPRLRSARFNQKLPAGFILTPATPKFFTSTSMPRLRGTGTPACPPAGILFIHNPFLLKERGVVHYEMKRYAEAERDFRKSLALKPGNPITWIELGNVLDMQLKHGPAEQAYRKAIKLDPGQREARYNLAICLYKQQKWAAALTELKGEEKMGPVTSPNLYRLKIACLRKLDRHDEVPAVQQKLDALMKKAAGL